MRRACYLWVFLPEAYHPHPTVGRASDKPKEHQTFHSVQMCLKRQIDRAHDLDLCSRASTLLNSTQLLIRGTHAAWMLRRPELHVLNRGRAFN